MVVEQAKKAIEAGRNIFYSTDKGISVGSGGTLYYNAASSKLAGELKPPSAFVLETFLQKSISILQKIFHVCSNSRGCCV